MEDLQTTDTPQATDSTEAVDTSVADSESLLGQETTEEVTKEVSEDLKNPLTDDVEEEQEVQEEENKEVVEVDYEKITLPEGQELIPEFKEIVTKHGLNQEQTQAMVDLKSTIDKQSAEKAESEFKEVVENLQKETKEMLGVDYKKEMSYAEKAMNLLPKDEKAELKSVLNVSGIGNHPMIVKMFIAAGKALSEDKFVDGNSNIQSEPVDSALGLASGLLKHKEK